MIIKKLAYKIMSNIIWSKLPFGYHKTKKNIRCSFKNEAWGELREEESEEITMHIASTCLQYGQAFFEGLKAFRGQDNKIRIFRPDENAKRFNSSARGVLMPELPEEIFIEAVKKAVIANAEFVPPYGTGASLYIRPFMVGVGAQLGLQPSQEYEFIIFVSPVGPYFKNGFKPVDVMIDREHDRVAPLGTGRIKVAGNYAATMLPLRKAVDHGYASVLFLDPLEKKYIDECGPANFFAVKDNTYITPDSPTILPSITNLSIRQIAHDLGLKVEQRKVAVEELADFEEVGACGTAAIITPIKKIDDIDVGKIYEYCPNGEAGPVTTKIYERYQAIQTGDVADVYGWNILV